MIPLLKRNFLLAKSAGMDKNDETRLSGTNTGITGLYCIDKS